MLAKMHVVNKCHPCLIGRHFNLKTNNDSLKCLLDQQLSLKEKNKGYKDARL
jgi:hypothetical protein